MGLGAGFSTGLGQAVTRDGGGGPGGGGGGGGGGGVEADVVVIVSFEVRVISTHFSTRPSPMFSDPLAICSFGRLAMLEPWCNKLETYEDPQNRGGRTYHFIIIVSNGRIHLQ